MKANAKVSTTHVYSYTRFSQPDQKEGDSQERQDDKALAWAKRHGHVLDTKLKLRDKGRSAFHGHHRTKGYLGLFLKAVESGKVPKGSILLVENIDRLGRETPGEHADRRSGVWCAVRWPFAT